jgi:aspartyl-tRNA synthetase
MLRTHHCGTLRSEHIGETVTLCGWANVVRDQSHQMFIDLRDRSGLVQCVVDRDQQPQAHAALENVKSEFCLQLTGIVARRLPGKENPNLETAKSSASSGR